MGVLITPVEAKSNLENLIPISNFDSNYSVDIPLPQFTFTENKIGIGCGLNSDIKKEEIEEKLNSLTQQVHKVEEKEEEEQRRIYLESITFTKPTERLLYTSYFGWRTNPITNVGSEFHTGVDIAGGGRIFSVLKGKVIRVQFEEGYGNYIDIDHGYIDGKYLITRYAHLRSFNVRVGQEVAKGEVIGIMGTTGRSTGVHLHFEVIENGKRVNPLNYLSR